MQVGDITRINAEIDRVRSIEAWMLVRRATLNYDVFFSYNVADRDFIHTIARQLINIGIMPWLYEWDGRKGERFMKEIEEAIGHCRSAAIFVGSNGVGQWQDEESDLLVSEGKRRHEFVVIPVALPDISGDPPFRAFLKTRARVDFRQSTPDPLTDLARAILGPIAFDAAHLIQKMPE